LLVCSTGAQVTGEGGSEKEVKAHLAHVLGLVAVPHLESLVDARGGAGGHRRAEDAQLGGHVDLHGGVATGVEDLARLQGTNRGAAISGGELAARMKHTRPSEPPQLGATGSHAGKRLVHGGAEAEMRPSGPARMSAPRIRHLATTRAAKRRPPALLALYRAAVSGPQLVRTPALGAGPLIARRRHTRCALPYRDAGRLVRPAAQPTARATQLRTFTAVMVVPDILAMHTRPTKGHAHVCRTRSAAATNAMGGHWQQQSPARGGHDAAGCRGVWSGGVWHTPCVHAQRPKAPRHRGHETP